MINHTAEYYESIFVANENPFHLARSMAHDLVLCAIV